MVRKVRTTIIVSGVVAALTCGAAVQVYGPTGMRTSTSIGNIHAIQQDQ